MREEATVNTDMVVLGSLAHVSLDQPMPKPTATGGDPMEALRQVWAASDGSLECGVWECTPGTFSARRDGYDELCLILSGTVKVTQASGESAMLGPGDLLVTPAGWVGEWEVVETVRKVFVIRTASDRVD